MLHEKLILQYLQEFTDKAEKHRSDYWDNGSTRSRKAAERAEDLRDICSYALNKLREAKEEVLK